VKNVQYVGKSEAHHVKDRIVNKMLKKHLVDFSTIIFIFLIDRVSKLLIISSPETYEQYGISITSFLNFNLIWNEGIAFGLFSFDEKFYYNLLTIIICLVILIIIWLMLKSKGFEKISFLLIIGGSLGNIYDRFYYSAVPDFIDIHFNNYHWFIFNVADIFITLGIICLISIEIVGNKNFKNENY
jgi:signal peptidase II